MISRSYQIRRCLNPGCELRYPLLVGSPFGERCPHCRSETEEVAQHGFAPEPEQTPSVLHPPLDAFLDNVRSAWNVGSMFRTADGLGLSRLYLGGISPTPENPKVAKTSLGAEASVAWEYHPDGVQLARRLIDSGRSLWALECTPDAVPLTGIPGSSPEAGVVLVVGNENFGVDPDILSLCERKLCIPMEGRKRSLNAAVAFGVAVYGLRTALAGSKPG